MSKGTYAALKIVPCECGSKEAYWHGDTRRVYCCDACWHRMQDSTNHQKRTITGA